ncbi:uncharacterized protein [Anabrus simplex]|uniref:uncharacterized protein isoform X3 n=1 Tax=Anabrus simplex TaxID=316456 RepID=UPI0035A381E3
MWRTSLPGGGSSIWLFPGQTSMCCRIMHSIALYVSGNDEHGRMIRRTLMRYLNLSLILVLRSISSAVKRRFPTLEHVVEAGFMTVTELEMYQSVPSVEFNTYWIPCTWFISLLKETKKSSRITDSQGLKIIMEEFNDFRSKCGLLWSYDWVSIPLVYTQVVTIATYSFFLAALVGRQYVDAAKKPLQMEIDIYIPVFTILQFFFFMGLLKVAEQLINPFGDDDEDFELNWLIDRHTKVSYLGVDTLMRTAPPLVKDMYFDQVDLTLPYTEASVAYKKKTYRGSVHNMQVPEEKHTMFLPEITEEDEDKTPTPKSSHTNLHNAANTGATVSAAAAGTWRSHPSTRSLYKGSEVDFELETDTSSYHHLEIYMGGSKSDTGGQTKKEGEAVSMTDSTRHNIPVKPARPLSRSESLPVKNPSISESYRTAAWPSSSTLGLMDTSLQCSDRSIEIHSCNNSSSLLIGADGEHINDSNHALNPDTNMTGKGNEPLHQYLQRLSYKRQTSEVSLDSYETANVSEYLPPSPRFESREKLFQTGKELKKGHVTKVKSCPKLAHIRLSTGSNRKKGVRWKPMTDDAANYNKSEKSRRRTVDVVPVMPRSDSSRMSLSCDTPSMKEDVGASPQIYCKSCNTKLEHTQGSQSPRISPDLQLSVSGSLSNTSLVHDHHHSQQDSISTNLPHFVVNKNNAEGRRVQLPSKPGTNEERRATISVLNITGTEFDTKRWQGKPLWQHKFSSGFLRRLRGIKFREDVLDPTSNEMSKVKYSKSTQSMPNIRLPAFHETVEPLRHTPVTLCQAPNTVPTIVRISDTSPSNISDSDDSSLFSSISEIPVQESTSYDAPKSRTVVEDTELSVKSILHIPASYASLSSHTNLLQSSNSSEVLNRSSHDSSWQSADWTTLLRGDTNHGDQMSTKDTAIGKKRGDSEQSEERVDTAGNAGLQEVIVDSRPRERWGNENGS